MSTEETVVHPNQISNSCGADSSPK
jgi:hypothetical protein